jgi:uncharacterized protein YggE
MRIHWLGIALLAAQSAVFAQMDSNTLTITATRALNLQPDQAVLGIYINTPLSTGLDQVTSTLSGTGITAANLVSVNTQPAVQPILGSTQAAQALQWTFNVTVPFSKMKDTLASLATSQQGIGQQSGWSLTYFVQGTKVSAELLASEACALPALVSDARAQAQQVAAAAGVSVGAIVALSDGGGVSLPVANSVSGQFASFSGATPTLGFASFLLAPAIITSPAPSCSLTVQFQLR